MLEVIGAGLGRTGTHSLGLALEQLGLGPCYHINEVAKNAGHTELWNHAIDGKPVDWSHIFGSYQSSVEWPGAAFWRELIHYYANAKVVLTVREPDEWYESASKTIFESLELSAYNPDPIKRESGSMNRRLILERTFAGRYHDKQFAIDTYQKHNQQLVDTVPSTRLLTFDVRDGWEPLCSFLQKPVPNEPFPRLNERSDFMASEPDWAKQIKRENKA